MSLITTTKNICLQHKLFGPGDRILVGVSGGPDSVALLHVLYALRHFLGIQLSVAHLNHGLRSQAVAEQAYVKTLAKQLGLPLFTKTLKLKKTKGSLEEKAREARLAFLTETARKLKAQGIALGHHQDDLVETILMRLLRGTGPSGIKGMGPKRVLNGIAVIRPFLTTNRRAIEQFLREKRIKFYTDASNDDTAFQRNKIRLHLLPLLEKMYNPNIKETLVHFSQSVALTHDYLKVEAEQVFRKLATPNKKSSSLALSTQKLLRLHPALSREILRLAIEKQLGHLRGITFKHIEAMEGLICHQPITTMVFLPHQLIVQKKKSSMVIRRHKTTLDKK